MKSTELTPNRRILLVDDNTSIHTDFRNILCPDTTANTTVDAMEAVLFDEVKSPTEEVTFELESAFQGQEALEMVKLAVAEKDNDLFLAAGANGDAAIYTNHATFLHVLRKVILRVGSITNYLVLKLH